MVWFAGFSSVPPPGCGCPLTIAGLRVTLDRLPDGQRGQRPSRPRKVSGSACSRRLRARTDESFSGTAFAADRKDARAATMHASAMSKASASISRRCTGSTISNRISRGINDLPGNGIGRRDDASAPVPATAAALGEAAAQLALGLDVLARHGVGEFAEALQSGQLSRQRSGWRPLVGAAAVARHRPAPRPSSLSGRAGRPRSPGSGARASAACTLPPAFRVHHHFARSARKARGANRPRPAGCARRSGVAPAWQETLPSGRRRGPLLATGGGVAMVVGRQAAFRSTWAGSRQGQEFMGGLVSCGTSQATVAGVYCETTAQPTSPSTASAGAEPSRSVSSAPAIRECAAPATGFFMQNVQPSPASRSGFIVASRGGDAERRPASAVNGV